MKKWQNHLLSWTILTWMVAVTGLFALVMLPQDSGLVELLPSPITTVQAFVFNLFYSASVLW